jgi:hypothetical protein
MVEVQMNLIEIKLDFQVHKENMKNLMLTKTRTEKKQIIFRNYILLYLFEMIYLMNVIKMVHLHKLLYQTYLDRSKRKFL